MEVNKMMSKIPINLEDVDNKNLTNPLAEARGINREIFGIEKFQTKV